MIRETWMKIIMNEREAARVKREKKATWNAFNDLITFPAN